MGKHKPPSSAQSKVDKQKRYERKKAKRGLFKGLRTDPRAGYKRAK